jgi:hypothetical protein
LWDRKGKSQSCIACRDSKIRCEPVGGEKMAKKRSREEGKKDADVERTPKHQKPEAAGPSRSRSRDSVVEAGEVIRELVGAIWGLTAEVRNLRCSEYSLGRSIGDTLTSINTMMWQLWCGKSEAEELGEEDISEADIRELSAEAREAEKEAEKEVEKEVENDETETL